MATKNSGISAKLSLDNSGYEKAISQSAKSTKAFSSESSKFPLINLGPSIKLTDTFTTRVDAGTKALQRMRVQAESVTTSVAKGIQAMNNMASGLGAGLHIGAGGGGSGRMPLPAIGQRMQFGTKMGWADQGYVDRSKAVQGSFPRQTLSANADMMRGRGGATNAGMGLLMLSQTIDDLQYGIRGVVNNIAPLVMAIGGGTGLAGAATIAAVALNQLSPALDKLWNNVTGETAYQKTLKAGTEAMEQHRRQLERMLAESALYTEQRAELAQRVARYEDDAMKRQQEQHDARMTQLTQEQRIQTAGLSRLEGYDREKAALELGKQQNKDTAAADVAFYENQVSNLRNRMGMDNYNRSANERKLTDLKAELDQLNMKPDDAISEQSRRRKAALPGLISEARTDYESEQARFRSANERLRDARARQAAVPGENRAADAEFNAKQREEMQRNSKAYTDGVQRMREGVNEWNRELERVKVQLRQEAAVRQEANRRQAEDSRISRLAGGGHTRRAQRALATETQRRRVQEILNENPGMSVADAEAQAHAENPETGRIRRGADTRPNSGAGGLDNRGTSALDAFRSRRGSALDAFRDGNLPTPKEAAEMERQRKGKPAAGPEQKGPNWFDKAMTKLDEVITVLRDSAKTPAERAKPLRSN